MTQYRVGHGFDVHALVKARKLILGGVEIDYEKGLDGHSDADVLIHALCDALLGAAALGDIGRHFPDSDSKWKDADSRVLLREVMQLIQPYQVENVDITVIAQAPKLQPYISKMISNLARDMSIDSNKINVKATTTEKLGAIGRGEGIAAEAIALIQKK